MPIQTSQITTETNGNLSISPNGTGETLISSVDVTRADAGTTEDTPVSVAPDGTIKKVDLSTLPVIGADSLTSTDLIAVQKADGDFYYVEADSLGGQSVINPPDNATLVITPAAGSGSGTSASPYILNSVTVNEPGGTEQTVETFSITGAPAGGVLYVTFTDSQGGRFIDLVKIADASGNVAPFNLTFIDEPESTTGTTYTGKVRFGQASVYCNWGATVQVSNSNFVGADGSTPAPNGSPSGVSGDGIFGTGSATWADGSRTISSTGDIAFQVNGGGFNTGPTATSDGDTVDVIFVQSAVDSASEGDTISGTLVSSDNAFTETFSMVKDISPDANLGSASDVSLGVSVASSSIVLTGYNATIDVTAGTAGANEMTNITVSIDNGAFVSLPTTMFPGQSISVQGTVGTANSTTYTANLNLGNTSSVFNAITTGIPPAVQQPSITSPTSGSTGIVLPTSIVGDTYTPQGGAGTHQDSDWEIYQGAVANPEMGAITAVNDITYTYSDPSYFENTSGSIQNASRGFNGTFGTSGSEDFNFASSSSTGTGQRCKFTFPTPLFIEEGVECGVMQSGNEEIIVTYIKDGVQYTTTSGLITGDNVGQTYTFDGGVTGRIVDGKTSTSADYAIYMQPYLVSANAKNKMKAMLLLTGPFVLLSTESVSVSGANRAKFGGFWLGDSYVVDGFIQTELTLDSSIPDSKMSLFDSGHSLEEVGNGDDGVGTILYKSYIGDELGSTENKLVLTQQEANWDVGSYIKDISTIEAVTTPPTTDPPSTADYTLIDSSLADTTNLESYTTSGGYSVAGPITGVGSANYNLPAARRFTESTQGPGNAGITRNTTAFTVTEATLSCWWRDQQGDNTSTDGRRAFFYSEFSSGNDRSAFAYDRNGGDYKVVQDGSNVNYSIPGGAVPYDEWHHVVYKIVGTQTTVYHDGVSLGTQTTTNALKNLGVGHDGYINTQSNSIFGAFDQCEMIFVSDKAHDPTTFGYTTDSGEWVTLSRQQVLENLNSDFGQNGFYLDYDPSTGNGALADKSGNGNDFTEATATSTTALTSPDTPGQSNVTELSFAVGTDLTGFGIGNEAEESGNGNDGVGTIAFVDTGSAKVYLDAVEPNWDAGSDLKSPLALDPGTSLFSRVKYRSNDPVESQWSDWNDFSV